VIIVGAVSAYVPIRTMYILRPRRAWGPCRGDL